MRISVSDSEYGKFNDYDVRFLSNAERTKKSGLPAAVSEILWKGTGMVAAYAFDGMNLLWKRSEYPESGLKISRHLTYFL